MELQKQARSFTDGSGLCIKQVTLTPHKDRLQTTGRRMSQNVVTRVCGKYDKGMGIGRSSDHEA